MAKERLSKLQKWILCQAYLENAVSRRQIYEEFYGVKLTPMNKGKRGSNSWWLFGNKYVAVCHSLKSLRERELIKMEKDESSGRYKDPIRLTDRGRKVVEELEK